MNEDHDRGADAFFQIPTEGPSIIRTLVPPVIHFTTGTFCGLPPEGLRMIRHMVMPASAEGREREMS